MAALQISDELVQAIQATAETQGVSVEEFLQSAIQRQRTLFERRKIQQEQDWWMSLPLSERAKYEGEYIAVHNKTLVDHDRDNEALHRRIRAKYGNIAILMMPAEGPRDIHIYSTRIVRP